MLYPQANNVSLSDPVFDPVSDPKSDPKLTLNLTPEDPIQDFHSAKKDFGQHKGSPHDFHDFRPFFNKKQGVSYGIRSQTCNFTFFALFLKT